MRPFYKIFIDPIREHEAAVLIATIALAIALQEVMLLIFSGDYLSVPPPWLQDISQFWALKPFISN